MCCGRKEGADEAASVSAHGELSGDRSTETDARASRGEPTTAHSTSTRLVSTVWVSEAALCSGCSCESDRCARACERGRSPSASAERFVREGAHEGASPHCSYQKSKISVTVSE